jgi:hypothetical protein
MKTMARLRTKFGGRIEDVLLPVFSVPIGFNGWQFISAFKGKIPKELIDRYSMIYVPNDFCTVHDRKECYCYEI